MHCKRKGTLNFIGSIQKKWVSQSECLINSGRKYDPEKAKLPSELQTIMGKTRWRIFADKVGV